MAVEQREAARGETVIHSDHGTQFTSWAFTESSHVRAGAIDGPHRRLQRQRADRSVVVTDADRAARHAPLDDARRTRRREKESLTSLSGDYGLVVSAGNERWSTYGAQRSQPVAIGGKWNARESGSKRRKPLPWVATSCLRRSMVRRGSTVRVRQRACTIYLQNASYLVANETVGVNPGDLGTGLAHHLMGVVSSARSDRPRGDRPRRAKGRRAPPPPRRAFGRSPTSRRG
jgi:hypothetical protein